VRRIPATLRPHGGLRYQCPVNGSFILVTDDPTLERLGQTLGRLRCLDCGEMHLLSQD
jgi:hypothetical protein